MKIDNIAMALDAGYSDVLDILEFYRLIEAKKTGAKSEEGHEIVNHYLTDLAQFFCDGYEQEIEAYDVDWHVDKLFKLSQFKDYVNL